MSEITNSLRASHFVDSSNGWAVGHEGFVLHTRDGGNTWEQQENHTPSLTSFSNDLESVHFTTVSDGWAVGAPGKIIFTHNGGNTWNIKDVAAWNRGDGPPLRDVFFWDSNTGWIVGELPTFCSSCSYTHSTILKTTDGGDTWNLVTLDDSFNFHLGEVFFINSLQGWAAGSSAEIIHTTDGGTTWTMQPTGTNLDLYHVFFADANSGWATGGGMFSSILLHTADGGQTWNTQRYYEGTDLDVFYGSIHFVDTSTGWMSTSTGIEYTSDGGETWVIETPAYVADIFFLAHGQGWAVGGTQIYKYQGGDPTYSATGHVRDGGGNPISGVAVSAGAAGSAVTDASGAYTITDLITSTYVFTASKSGYVFSPAARVVRVPPSVSNQDFTTTPVYGTLNGRVTVQGSGTAIANARVSAGGKVGRTGASGDYLLTSILPGLHSIYVSADGYEDYRGEVTIEADTSTTRDVALEAILVDGYYLPYPGGKTYECTQGNGGSFSHQGSWLYAFDFGMPDGRKVVAARDGRVVTVKEDSNTSCNSRACIPYANYVRIRHEDGTDTLYYHLKYQRVFVEEGQCVSRGQVIAESDTTGWCTGAHLDFTRHKWGQWFSRPIAFVDVPGDGVPRTSGRYTSGNYPVTTGVGESNVAEDTDPPRGSVQFRLTGQPTHILQLWAADYASDVTAVRLAATETDIQAATWQSFTTSAEWTGPVVFAQYKDANGNVSSVVSDTVDAIGYEPIQAAFAISPTVCVGSGLPLANQTVPCCEQCGWAWDFGDGTTSAEAEPQFDYVAMSSFSGYATPDTYTVTLTVSNMVSVSSVSHQVTALAAPAAEFSLIRSGATITVEAKATGASGWTWDFGDGITATGRIATHTYTDTSSLNTYPVQLVVEGNNGCASLGYQYVSSYALYLPLVLRSR